MTGLNLLMKRMMVENENLRNALEGKEIKPIEKELMTEEEIKVYKETGKQESLLTTGDFIRYFSDKNSKTKVNEEKETTIIEKPIVKTEQVIKQTSIKEEANEEKVEVKEEIKKEKDEDTLIEETVEIKDKEPEEKVEVKEEIKKEKDGNSSMKETVDFIKKKLSHLENKDDILIKSEPTDEKEEVTVEKETLDKNIQKKVNEVKTKIDTIVKDVKGSKISDILIKDYNQLSSSKKKEAISKMLKDIINDIAKSTTVDITDVINFGVNINSLANQHNKREYCSMLKMLKETLTKMKSNTLVESIIEKLDNEIKNLVLVNKIKFIEYIKTAKFDLEITEDNVSEIIATLDSISSRLNNGEDFDKILKSFKIDNKANSEDNHIEAKVVDTDENIAEENIDNDDNVSINTNNIFLTPDEVDSLASTMHEVLMGL